MFLYLVAKLKIILQSIKRILFVIAATLCAKSISLADIDNYENLKKYMKCAVLQNVVANILSETEKDFYQHNYHQAARDSMIVAMEFVKISEHSKDTVDRLYGL